MMYLSKWISATLATVLLAGTVAADDVVTYGKIKSVNAEKKSFVLTDPDNKDHTLKFGDKLIINRDAQEGKTDLRIGDSVNVCHDKGILSWTAHYILVQDGKNKNSGLVRGSFKSYEADTKRITMTDVDAKLWGFAVGKATKVRINMAEGKVEDIKIGDHTLVIMDTIGDKTTLTSVMVHRAK